MKDSFLRGPADGKKSLEKYKTFLKTELKKFDTKQLPIKPLEI